MTWRWRSAVEEPIKPPIKVDYDQLLINGKFVDAASGKIFPTLVPRTGEVIVHVAEGDAEDINRVVSAARKAFDDGPQPRMLAYERSRIMLCFADLVEKHNYEIEALETWDNGKPYEQSANIEVPMFARLFRYYVGWEDKIHGLTVPVDGPIPCWLPEGVLNVISGFGSTVGDSLSNHMEVDKIAFTGSTETGKIVVCEDADVDKAVELAHFALLFNQGQCCCVGSLTYVHERVYDEFIAKAKARAMKRIVGDPFKRGIEQGPQGVLSLIFDKTVLEPIFCPMCAMLCSDLNEKLPPFPSEEPGGKDVTFKRTSANKHLKGTD